MKLGVTEDVGVRLFRHENLKELGEGTDVCFYDKRAPTQNWVDPIANPSEKTYCAFFFKAEGQWFTNYNFVD